jgi:hypothetical protein
MGGLGWGGPQVRAGGAQVYLPAHGRQLTGDRRRGADEPCKLWPQMWP